MHLSPLIRLWFLADLILALLPPLHWVMGDGSWPFGVPRVLIYLFGSSAFIAASVVTAFLTERRAA